MEKHARKFDETRIWTDSELEKLEHHIAAKYKKVADELINKINYFLISKFMGDENLL